jgi:hypothetical protein
MEVVVIMASRLLQLKKMCQIVKRTKAEEREGEKHISGSIRRKENVCGQEPERRKG